MKRIIDIGISLISLLILSPLFLTIALIIKITSKGDVFFTQNRVGQYGRIFKLYKFRSMVSNAESIGPYYTQANDQRITGIGRFLRKTSLDELPQLINVLKGDMSLVGPRPDVPAQRELYTEEEWMMRTKVKPGITGLAQATYRSDATMEIRKQLDLEYVKTRSIWLDFKIILWTMKQVLRKGGY